MEFSRWPLVAVTVAVALAITSTAHAQVARPKLKIIDRGAQVEVVVSDVQLPASPTMSVRFDRIELPLAGRPVEVNDSYPRGLVVRIDVRNDGKAKTLIVRLRRSYAVVAELAKGAVARQENDGVHLLVPISPAAATMAAALPATAVGAGAGAATGTTATVATTAGATPATAAPTAPTTTPTTTVTAPTTPPAAPVGATSGTTVTLAGATTPPATNKPDPAATTGANGTGAGTSDATATANDATGSATTTPDGANAAAGANAAEPLAGPHLTGKGSTTPAPARLTGGDRNSGPGIGRVAIAIGAIALAGGAIVLLRRRRGTATAAIGPQFEVLASKSLGGKTRVVWLGAGDRELVVAVAAQQVNLLGHWRRGEADRPIDRALEQSVPLRLEPVGEDLEPAFAAGSSPLPRVRGAASSAVSGIMRLRGKVAAISDEVATGDADADEQWARDILAATGGRR